MKVELTQEQIDFISFLCHCVYEDYDNYSPMEQRKREAIAENIIGVLLNAEED